MSAPVSKRTTRTPLKVMAKVWQALFIREVLGRVLAQRAGLFWLFMDPLIHIAFIMLLFATIRQERNFASGEFLVFFAVSVMGFKISAGVISRTSGAAAGNAALLTYRQVLPIDTVFVRAMSEGLLIFMVAVIFLSCLALFGYHTWPADPLKLLMAYGLLWLLGMGLGMILSVLSTFAPEMDKFIGIIMLPLHLVSGVLYTPATLPPQIRDILLYNPIIHGLEMARSAFFPGYYVLPEISMSYIATWAASFILLGLMLHRRYEARFGAK